MHWTCSSFHFQSSFWQEQARVGCKWQALLIIEEFNNKCSSRPVAIISKASDDTFNQLKKILVILCESGMYANF